MLSFSDTRIRSRVVAAAHAYECCFRACPSPAAQRDRVDLDDVSGPLKKLCQVPSARMAENTVMLYSCSVAHL